MVDDPDVLSIYSELHDLRGVVETHSNHLGTLQVSADLALTYLRVFALALGVNLTLMGAVIVLSLR